MCIVIHYGPAKNVESSIQETGRAGRDGTQSCVYILYHGILLAHIDGYMKRYVKTNLLKHFNCITWQHEVLHLCRDKCAADCECSLPDCGALAFYPCSQ